MRFSPRYKTYRSWLRAKSRNSSYAKSIINRHRISPHSNLNQLRVNHISSQALSSWSSLSSSQKAGRKLSLEVLRSMRKGNSLNLASHNVGLSIKHIKQYLGKTIYKSKGRWIARKFDIIERSMRIYSQGRIKTVLVRNSSDAKLIGQYYSAVRKYLQTGDQTILHKYKDVQIEDANGISHSLETNPEKIKGIEDGKEDPEFFEVYSDD